MKFGRARNQEGFNKIRERDLKQKVKFDWTWTWFKARD